MTDQHVPRGGKPHVDLEGLIHHTELPNTRISKFLDVSTGWAGYVAVISSVNAGEIPG
jgi:hypothetical protein